jgi:cold shock CspA family protein
MRGRVVAFDEHVGLGEIEADDGRRYPFHCTRIAGGTRAIDVGARVAFEIEPGHLGRWEATAVTPASAHTGYR